MMGARVELIAVGTELLVHGRVDTNSAELGEVLSRVGFQVDRATSIGDGLEELEAAFREAAARSPLVISTGGLGPTSDDRTRDALVRAFDRELRFHPEILRELERRFQQRGMKMPRSNRRQADVPEGAEAIPNPEGTAPGLWLEHPGGVVIALPGPPVEMRRSSVRRSWSGSNDVSVRGSWRSECCARPGSPSRPWRIGSTTCRSHNAATCSPACPAPATARPSSTFSTPSASESGSTLLLHSTSGARPWAISRPRSSTARVPPSSIASSGSWVM